MRKLQLSVAELKTWQQDIDALKTDLPRLADEIVDNTLKAGLASVEQSLAPIVPYMDITNTIEHTVPAKGALVQTGSQVGFVEFGTGYVGLHSMRNPASPEWWIHDIHQHGESGWWFWDEKEGQYVWTQGIMPMASMYYAGQLMREVMKSEFRRLLK